jgi:hypothetical protein
MKLEFCPARTFDELQQAYALVYANYVSRGYCAPHPSQMRFSLHNALPQALTFVGKIRGAVTATVSLLPDSPLGLPLDRIYREQVEPLRQQGRRLAEVALLSDRRDVDSGERLAIPLLRLFKLVFDYCRHLRVDDLLVTCSATRHEGYYARFLAFERFGPHVPLDTVNGQLTTLLRLDMHRVDDVQCHSSLVKGFFLENPVPAEFFSQRFRHNEVTLRRLFAELRPLLQEATPGQIEYLSSCYPAIDIPALVAGPVAELAYSMSGAEPGWA